MITQDKLFEYAIESDLLVDHFGMAITANLRTTSETIPMLTKFADLVSANAITSMQTEQQKISMPDSPKKIWLNIGDCDESELADCSWESLAELTWSSEEIDKCDIPYIRADLAHPAPVTSMQGDSEPVKLNEEMIRLLQIGELDGYESVWEDVLNAAKGNDRVKGVSDSTIEKLAVKHGVLAEYKPMLDKLPTLKESRERLLEKITKFCNEYASQLSTNTDGWVSVPIELDKARFIGEFSVDVDHTCSACSFHGAQEDCEVCGGEIYYLQKHVISWADLKCIYKELISPPINAISQDKGESV